MLPNLLSEKSNGVVPYIGGGLLNEVERMLQPSFLSEKDREFSLKPFPIDIIEKNDCYVVRASLPGIAKDHVEITCEGKYLTIKVAEEDNTEVKDGRYLRRECFTGTQLRKIVLPQTADSERIDASMKDGILEVSITKKVENLPKRIAIT